MGKLSELLSAPPPPAYEKVAKHRVNHKRTTAAGLDVDIWLRILSHLVNVKQSKERQAVAWAHLHRDVRFVCKDMYMICMHLLRSNYLQRYMNRIRSPFTSDPYPTGQMMEMNAAPSSSNAHTQFSYASTSTSTLSSNQFESSSSSHNRRSGNGAGRETRVFDLYIAGSVRSDVEAYESSLLESTLGDDEQAESDLFTVHQPQSRLEDLVIALGRKKGIIRPDGEDENDVDEKGTYKDEKPPSYSFSSSSSSAMAKKATSDHRCQRCSRRPAQSFCLFAHTKSTKYLTRFTIHL